MGLRRPCAGRRGRSGERRGQRERIGAQAQRPLAIVVIGGSLALAGLTRVVQPPLLVIAHQLASKLRAEPAQARDVAA